MLVIKKQKFSSFHQLGKYVGRLNKYEKLFTKIKSIVSTACWRIYLYEKM